MNKVVLPPLPERSCTCHPDDNPPVPCPKKYALRECVTAHAAAALLRQWPEGEPVAVEKLRLAGLALIGLSEHDQHCEVFDLDDDGRHKACTCGLDDSIAVITQAGKIAPPAESERIAALEEELSSVLSDWNDIVKASGSPTNGGAVGHVAAMVRRIAALEAENAMLRAELRKMPKAKYVAVVTDCEACLTPDACAIRGQCAHYLRTTDNAAERIAALERELANAYAEGRKDEREEWTAEFKPSGGGCTCAGPDGPCESCEANRAAYEEWLAERPWHARIAALEAEQRELENNVADLFAAARRHHARVQELEAALEQAREALEKSRRSEHNPFETDNQSEHYERLCAALRAIEGVQK